VAKGSKLGLYINTKKCEWLDLHSAPCPIPNVTVLDTNCPMLGSPVGTKQYSEKYIMDKLGKNSSLFDALIDLDDTQSALLLLRHCLSFCKAVYYMRTVPINLFPNVATHFDKEVARCLEGLLPSPLPPKSYTQATLATSLGGLGLRSVTLHAPGAFLASFHQSKKLLSQFGCNNLSGLDSQCNLLLEQFQVSCGDKSALAPTSQKDASTLIDQFSYSTLLKASSKSDSARIKAVSAPHANAWLNAPPIDYLGMAIRHEEYQVAVCRWLGVPLVPDGTICNACHIPMSPRLSHATKCKVGGHIVTRHHRLRDLVFDLSSNALLAPQKEKGNLLGDDYAGMRPADVYIPSLFGCKPAALDLAVTCPLQNKHIDHPCPADIYALKKHAKYDAGFEGSDVQFFPMVTDTFGHWGEEGTSVLKDILQKGADRLSVPRASYITEGWQRLGACLQRSIAKMMLDKVAVEWL